MTDEQYESIMNRIEAVEVNTMKELERHVLALQNNQQSIVTNQSRAHDNLIALFTRIRI